MMSRRVVFTGVGVMSPNGSGKTQFWENTCNGVSGVRRISSFDPSGLDCQIAGQVQDFDPGEYFSDADLKKLPRTVPLGVAAAKEASSDAGIDLDEFSEEDFESLGVLIGTGGSGFDFSEIQFGHYFAEEFHKIRNGKDESD